MTENDRESDNGSSLNSRPNIDFFWLLEWTLSKLIRYFIDPMTAVVFINKHTKILCTFVTKENIFRTLGLEVTKPAHLFTKFYPLIDVIFVEFVVNLYFVWMNFVNFHYTMASAKRNCHESRDTTQ